jgi:spore maturation protein CgeB
VEAEFFGSLEELLEKIQYYLINKDKRQDIAAAGRRRCLEVGYSNVDRLENIMRQILTEK